DGTAVAWSPGGPDAVALWRPLSRLPRRRARPRRQRMLMQRALAVLFPSELAVDLGTANTLVYVPGRGVVVNEPSIVALRTADRSVLAVGAEAKAMLGRAPGSIEVIRPLRHGVIADYDSTEKMLHHFIRRTHQVGNLARPRIVISVPSGITQVERRA